MKKYFQMPPRTLLVSRLGVPADSDLAQVHAANIARLNSDSMKSGWIPKVESMDS